ncbi:MAG: cysteine peptidase family C39 domain-containing protein [Dehalococcoidia bacterium]
MSPVLRLRWRNALRDGREKKALLFTWTWLSLLFALTLPRIRAQVPSDVPLVEEIARTFADVACAMRDMTVKGRIVIRAKSGRAINPGHETPFTYKSLAGRVWLHVDQDLVRRRRQPGYDRHEQNYLWSPDGRREVFAPSTKIWKKTESQPRNTRHRTEPPLPHGYVWACMQVPRSKLLREREVELITITGEPPRRVVTLRLWAKVRGAFLEWRLREDWNWMAEQSLFYVVGADGPQMTKEVVVEDVHKTRFGAFPKIVHDWAHDALGQRDAPWRDVSVVYEKPSWKVGSFPATLWPEQEKPWQQGREYDARATWLRSMVAAHALSGNAAGQRGIPTWVWFVSIGCLSAAAVAFGRRRWIRVSGSALLIGAVLLSLFGGRREYEDVRGVCIQEWPSRFASPTLCAVDALYLGMACCGIDSSYGELYMLLDPGESGTTMARLRAVAEALGLQPRVERIVDYREPPVPTLCHLAKGHFVVITAADSAQVKVIDPGGGVFCMEWSDLRQSVSPLGLWFGVAQ